MFLDLIFGRYTDQYLVKRCFILDHEFVPASFIIYRFFERTGILTMTGSGETSYDFKYFKITFPREYVAHVEINRADKMNAFFEAFVASPSYLPTPMLNWHYTTSNAHF